MWFGGSSEDYQFEMFGPLHLGVNIVLLLVLLIIFTIRMNVQSQLVRKFEIATAISLILFEVLYHVWLIYTDRWDISHAIPIELSNISVFLVIILLLTKSKRLFEIAFFVGIGGAIQAMITPVLTFGWPHFRFFHFFYTHMMVIWIVFYFLKQYRYQVTLLSAVKAFIFMNLLLPFILLVNWLTGGNYWFVMRKPSGGSLLDFLGPHPWYILGMEAAAILFFLLLWLIFRTPASKRE